MKNIFSRHKESGPEDSGSAPEISGRKEESQSPEPAGFPESPLESRTLHVQYDAYWNLHTTIHINDTNQNQELYTITARNRKPQMRIKSHATNTEVATANFHALKTRIDMTLHDQSLSLESGGWQTRYSYTSLALNGEKMTWRPRKKLDDLNMVLLDGKGLAIARYKPDYKGKKRGGALELLPECWKTEELWEEVVVIALVVMHYKESQRIIAAAAAAT
ncbi:hypothetical protein H2200_003432 [Cladophialophora chaetospira]|uniref:DUF6593 domain-containing protein n=1 Tax=Cladophialophora chaetospira TaxID=386627 RepID=A0AA39CM99_9EURO|nr:hypothetical protein H2200_003432 [Cladophialophora chaetospira]